MHVEKKPSSHKADQFTINLTFNPCCNYLFPERCSSLPISTNTSTTSPYYISTIVLGAVSGAEFILICLICIVCLIACLLRCCRPRPVPPVYNDHDHPNANEHQVLLRNNDNGYRRED